jgi:hypothetical protein
MSTDKAFSTERALDMALEALEDLQRQYSSYPNSFWDWSKGRKAITAIKQALAAQPAPTVQEPEHIVHSNERYSPLLTRMMNKRVESNVKQVIHLYDEPASVQEPVAVTYKEVADTMNALWGGTLEQVQIAMELANKKLYTTPPAAQRPVAEPHKWVGLTDEEEDAAFEQSMEVRPKDASNKETRRLYARAIEAKLKEKNT